jgi:cell division protein FtsI/penicillin-binding protein 2
MQAELEYTLEEMKDIHRLTPKNNSAVQKGERELDGEEATDLEVRKARVEQLKKEIAREKDRLALFESEKAWVPGDTRNIAIGQGSVLATPLQMARLVAAIANGGKMLMPHLRTEQGRDYNAGRLPVSPRNLEVLRGAMREEVFGRQGTARQDELRKHDVAAKTGTAELGGVWNNGWIIGFAPFESPKISFAVVVERTKYHGGEVAGPLLAKILDAYFGKD